MVSWLEELGRLFAATPEGSGVVTRWSVADGLPAINGDRALLTQVMLNLLKNAAEAAAGDSRPKVDVTAAPFAGDRVRVAVADNGPGIPEALSRDVFLPFFTTKPTGTGIGLSLARQIVLLHGGQIAVVPGDGGRVEIVLPVI